MPPLVGKSNGRQQVARLELLFHDLYISQHILFKVLYRLIRWEPGGGMPDKLPLLFITIAELEEVIYGHKSCGAFHRVGKIPIATPENGHGAIQSLVQGVQTTFGVRKRL